MRQGEIAATVDTHEQPEQETITLMHGLMTGEIEAAST
jgi:hypothetical protein